MTVHTDYYVSQNVWSTLREENKKPRKPRSESEKLVFSVVRTHDRSQYLDVEKNNLINRIIRLFLRIINFFSSDKRYYSNSKIKNVIKNLNDDKALQDLKQGITIYDPELIQTMFEKETSSTSSSAPTTKTTSSSSKKPKIVPLPSSKDLQEVATNYKLNLEHLKYKFPDARKLEVKEPSKGFSLKTEMNRVLDYMFSLWPDEVTIVDDHYVSETNTQGEPTRIRETRHTKAECRERLLSKMQEIHDGTIRGGGSGAFTENNKTLLKNIYGNIFVKIQQERKNLSSKSEAQQNAFTDDVRRFIQQLSGSTLWHCSDRLVSDSTTYYLRFMENVRRTSEEVAKTSIADLIHEELLKIRRHLFRNVFNEIVTNSHDTSTERVIYAYFNKELCLHLPGFDDSGNYSSCAVPEKIEDFMIRFYQRYDVQYIIGRLCATINKAIKDDNARATTNSEKSGWYQKIAQVFEDLHGSNWYETQNAFNRDTFTFTPAGIRLLLSDLDIIEPTS